MKNIAILFLSMVFCSACVVVNGQNLDLTSSAKTTQGHDGSSEVDLSTGTLNVNIPIWNIESGGVSVPVSVNYSARGVKVNENASWVGLGWELLSGGVITRQKRDKLDETYNNDNGWEYGWLVSDFNVNRIQNFDPSQSEESVDAHFYPLVGCSRSNPDSENYDMEPDLFSYSFAGQSGKFVFSSDGAYNNKRIMLMPYKNLKIDADIELASPQLNINGFTITDELGNKYIFTEKETIETNSVFNDGIHGLGQGQTNPCPPTDDLPGEEPWCYEAYYQANGYRNPLLNFSEMYVPHEDFVWYAIYSNLLPPPRLKKSEYTISWHLSRIEPVSGGIINFVYENEEIDLDYGEYRIYRDFQNDSEVDELYSILYMNLKDNTRTLLPKISRKRISEIIIEDRIQVVFTPKLSDRLDYGGKAIDKISVYSLYNNTQTLMREVAFLTDYVDNKSNMATYASNDWENNRLFLNSIEIRDKNIIAPRKYEFEYFCDEQLPPQYSYAQDVWGYYNGQVANVTQIPEEYFYKEETGLSKLVPFGTPCDDDSMVLPGANRSPDIDAFNEHILSGTLKSVTYPTGVQENYSYMQNQFTLDVCGEGVIFGGGIQIVSKTTNSGQEEELITESYIYTDQQGQCSGKLNVMPRFGYLDPTSFSDPDPSNTNPELEYINYYVRTSEDLSENTNPIVTYDFARVVRSGNSGYMEYEFTNGGYHGQTQNQEEYFFPPINSFARFGGDRNPDVRGDRLDNIDLSPYAYPYGPIYNFWDKGLIKSITEYSQSGDKLKKTTYHYTKFSPSVENDFVFGIKLGFLENNHNPTLREPDAPLLQRPIALFSKYTLPTNVTNVIDYQETEIWDPLNSSKSTSSTVYYEYNDFGQVKTIITKDSDGVEQIVKRTFPYDYYYPNDPQFEYDEVNSDTMTRAIYLLSKLNIISDPIEVVQYIKRPNDPVEKVVSAVLSTYKWVTLDEPNDIDWPDLPVVSNNYIVSLNSPIPLQEFNNGHITDNVFVKDTRYKRISQNFRHSSINGKITETRLDKGQPSAIIYGYNNTTPIATAANSYLKEFGYSGFENEESNSWTCISGQIIHAEHRTGKYCASLNIGSDLHNSFVLDRLENQGYELSAWIKPTQSISSLTLSIRFYNGSSLVFSQSDNMANLTPNIWQYVSLKVSAELIESVGFFNNVIAMIQNTGTSNLYVDDILFVPQDASFSYKTIDPFIGITSETNTNNKTIFYEYDDHQNKTIIRNFEGYIVQRKTYTPVSQYVPRAFMIVEDIKKEVEWESEIDQLDSEYKTETVIYYDAQGRTKQSISLGVSPNGGDLVSFHSYDERGLESRQYLPFVTNSDGGNYIEDIVSKQTLFYLVEPKVAHTQFAYTETNFRNAPSSAIEEQSFPGFNWRLGSGHTSKRNFSLVENNHIVNFIYNSDNHTITSIGAGGSTVFYEDNNIIRTDVTDENGETLSEYKTHEGKLIASSYVDDNNTEQFTYYIYNEMNLLVVKLPPIITSQLLYTSSISLGLSDPLLMKYAVRFEYDASHRITKSYIPGVVEPTLTVYDNFDRPILTQDANMRLNHTWHFTKYDVKGRPVLNGIYIGDPLKNTQEAMQADADNFYNIPGNFNYERLDVNGSQSIELYTNRTFPQLSSTDLVGNVVYYDSYEFDVNSDFSFVPENYVTDFSTEIKGFVAGSKDLVEDTNPEAYLTGVSYYDAYGRPIQTYSQNHLGGFDRTTNNINYQGQVEASLQTHQGINQEEITQKRVYEYDHFGRLLGMTISVNNAEPYHMFINNYNELGQLVDKKLHKEGTGEALQSVDYKYNPRGWLTNINKANLYNENTIIKLDAEVAPDEYVMGVIYDSVKFKVLSLEGPPATFIRTLFMEINDYKELKIGKIDDPGDVRYFTFNESQNIKLREDQVDAEVFDKLVNQLGGSFLFTFSNHFFDEYQSQNFISSSISNMVEDKMHEMHFDDEVLIKSVKDYIMTFSQERIALSYFNEDRNDLFGMDLFYDTGNSTIEASPQYNGLLSAIRWQSAHNTGMRVYGYTYDSKYQMKKATYGSYDVDKGWEKTNRYSVYDIDYDKNGNILNLKRNGLIFDPGRQENYWGTMDNLTYTYNGNLLKAVQDAGIADFEGGSDFRDNGSYDALEYMYDDNGNMISDNNKQIERVQYTHLNLSKEVTFENGDQIKYLYTFGGRKLKKQYFSGGNLMYTYDYSGSVTYKNSMVEQIKTEEGRLLPNTTGDGFTPEYFLRDHLGNVRVVFSNNNGVAQLVKENHYYPFGMTMADLDYTATTDCSVQYQGKELQKESNLQWYDFGARMFDVQLGRWHVPDPVLQFSNPYVGMANDPINLVDPNGMFTDRVKSKPWLRGFEAVYKEFENRRLLKYIDEIKRMSFGKLPGDDHRLQMGMDSYDWMDEFAARCDARHDMVHYLLLAHAINTIDQYMKKILSIQADLTQAEIDEQERIALEEAEEMFKEFLSHGGYGLSSPDGGNGEDKNPEQSEYEKKWKEYLAERDLAMLEYYKRSYEFGLENSDSWYIINYGILYRKQFYKIYGKDLLIDFIELAVNTVPEIIMIIESYPVAMPTIYILIPPVDPYGFYRKPMGPS